MVKLTTAQLFLALSSYALAAPTLDEQGPAVDLGSVRIVGVEDVGGTQEFFGGTFVFLHSCVPHGLRIVTRYTLCRTTSWRSPVPTFTAEDRIGQGDVQRDLALQSDVSPGCTYSPVTFSIICSTNAITRRFPGSDLISPSQSQKTASPSTSPDRPGRHPTRSCLLWCGFTVEALQVRVAFTINVTAVY